MEFVVFYNPSTGEITECSTGPRRFHELDGRPFLVVDKFRHDWDVTHHVVDGELEEI